MVFLIYKIDCFGQDHVPGNQKQKSPCHTGEPGFQSDLFSDYHKRDEGNQTIEDVHRERKIRNLKTGYLYQKKRHNVI